MRRNFLSALPGRLFLALAMGCLLVPVCRAQEADLAKEALKLNNITGKTIIREQYQVLLAEPKEAKKLIEAALPLAKKKDQPFNYNAALILAKLAQDFKDLPASEVFYRICMGEAARLQSTEKLLVSYGGLVDAYYDSKKYGDAARVCKELMELKTDDGKPRIVMIAITNKMTGETEFIDEDSFDAAKRLKEGFGRLYIQTLAKQGKFDQALKLVDAIIKNNDSWVELRLKASILQDAGRFEEAVKAYEEVLARVAKEPKLDNEEREEYLERYRYALSGVYIEMNKTDKAAEILQKLIEAKPEVPSYYNDLGYIWADANMRLDESEKLIRKALDLDRKARKADANLAPEDDHDKGAYLDSLGWVMFRQKRYKEAKEVLLKAIEDKEAQHLEIFDHLGDACMALNETAAALQYWRKGLEYVGENRRDQERKAAVEKKIEKNSKQ